MLTLLPAAAHPAPPATASPAPPATADPAAFQRLLAGGLTGAGLFLVPWMVYLAVSLPASTQAFHWRAAWGGLDAMEAAGLLSTGILLRRGDARYCLTATATAALLVTDALFDVTTAPPGAGVLTSAAMAIFAELPAAALCTALGVRGLRRLLRLATIGSGPCEYWSSAQAPASTPLPGRWRATPRWPSCTPRPATLASASSPACTPSPRPIRPPWPRSRPGCGPTWS